MKKQKRTITAILAVALTFSFAGSVLAEPASVGENQATGENQAAEMEAPKERMALPARFGMPYSFPVKGQHPRVMFTEKDKPAIRANMTGPDGVHAMEKLRELLAQDVDGVLPETYKGVANLDYNVFAVVEAYAFDYAMNGNVENGKRAVAAARNVVKTFKYNPKGADVVREKGSTIYLSALVYDWCYPLMSGEDKRLFVDKAEELAATITGMGGWPMTEVYTVHGHNSETHIQRDLLALSIACYDEYPDMYNLVAGYIMNGLAPTKNWWYRSGTFHQGLGYNALRFGCELHGYFLFNRMNGTKIYSDDMGKVPFQEVYCQRPDGRSFPEGDTNGDSLFAKIPTWTRSDMPVLLYASSLFDDGYLKKEYQRWSNGYKWLSYNSFFPLISPVNFLIVNDPYVVPKPRTELPYTRLFGSPNGMMIARTGFNEGREDGAMVSEEWVKIPNERAGEENEPDNHWYYFQKNGKAYRRPDSASSGSLKAKTIDGKKYAFDTEGRMLYGWVDDGERQTDEDAWTYSDYYFGTEDNGAMQQGWARVSIDASSMDDVQPGYDFWDEDQDRWIDSSFAADATETVGRGPFAEEEEFDQLVETYADAFSSHKMRFYYFGGQNGAMLTGKQQVPLIKNEKKYEFMLETSGRYKGAGVYGEKDGKLYKAGKLVKPEEGEKYAIIKQYWENMPADATNTEKQYMDPDGDGKVDGILKKISVDEFMSEVCNSGIYDEKKDETVWTVRYNPTGVRYYLIDANGRIVKSKSNALNEDGYRFRVKNKKIQTITVKN